MSSIKNHLKLCAVLTLLLGSVAFSSSSTHATPMDIYVSQAGRDTNPGTLAQPLATLAAARDRIEALHKAGRLSKDGVVVMLRGGVYSLKQPFDLTALSDVSPAPVTYEAYKGESVSLSGGEVVTGWKAVTDPTVLARLDPTARANVLVADLKEDGIIDYGELKRRGFNIGSSPASLELFFKGAPMTLSRWPNNGQWATIAGTAADQGPDHFSYSGDRPLRWTNADDAWVHGFWGEEWADSYEKILSVNTAQHQIVTAPLIGFKYTPGYRWYVLNVLEELDTPGEFYLDRKSGLLYFWPPSNIAKGDAVVSMTNSLVHLDHVSNVTLRDITLEDCRGTAITILSGTHNLLDSVTVRNTGNDGIDIHDGTDTGVQNSEIYATGDGGITLDGGDRQTLTPGNCFVINSRIHDYSRIDLCYRPAIRIAGDGNRIAHDLIYNAPHAGILLAGNDHVIEFNDIHNVCLETGDCGAFYMGRNWTERGNIVRDNYFHNINGTRGLPGNANVSGVYLDDTVDGTSVTSNVFVNVQNGVLIGGGRDITVTNNIFAHCRTGISMDARGVEWAYGNIRPGGAWHMEENLDTVPYTKPPWSIRYPHLVNIMQDDYAVPKYDVIDNNIAYQCNLWLRITPKASKGVTLTANITDVNPLFVDAANGNYNLMPNSPALQNGFKPIPFGEIGLEKSK